jgi:hypothetical protein
MSSGTQISDMTNSGLDFPDGAFVPFVVSTNVDGLVTTSNYRYNAGLYLAKYSTLALTSGASLIGTTSDGDGTVQGALDNIINTLDEIQGSEGADLVGFTHTGTGAATQTVFARLDQTVFASDFTGYDPTGTTDSYAAIMAADVAARAQNKTLVLTGRPKVGTTMTLAGASNWLMQGTHFKPGDLQGGSYILKAATLNGPLLVIPPAAKGTVIQGLAIRGAVGNGGDGIQVTGDLVSLINCSVDLMGDDGVRIGSKVAGSFNADAFRIINLSTGYNGRDGLSIDDASGGPDANAGTVSGLWSLLNGRHGLYINRALLGNTFSGGVIEGNGTGAGGYGIYLDTNAAQNMFIGGNVENNVTGNLYQAVPLANTFVSVAVQGARYTNFGQVTFFSPVIIGSTGAGTGTYTTQKGMAWLNGPLVNYVIELAWSAHTGTGDMLIGMGDCAFSPNQVDARIPAFIPGTTYSEGITIGAGAQLVAGYNNNEDKVFLYTSSAGALTALPMDSSVTALRVSGVFYPLIPS